MKISLETKISILITIPLFAFVFLSGIHIYGNWKSYKQSQETQILTDLLSSTTKLVKGLQSERSDLGLWLIGTLTPEQIKSKRPVVSSASNDFLSLLQKSSLTTEVKTEIAKIDANLENLRKEVDKEISGEIFDKYNLLIASLIQFEIVVARQISIVDLQSSLLAINILEQSRESGAQLQSMLLPILMANSPMSVTNVAKMDKLYRGVVNNIENPLLEVSDHVKKNLDDFKNNEDWQMISMIYNSIIAKSGEGQYGLDLAGFNEGMDKAVMMLDGPVNQILEEVTQKVKTMTQQSIRAAIVMSLIIMLAMVFIFIIVRMFTRSLSKNLSEIAEQLLQNAEGVAGTAKGIRSSSEELSKASVEQASSLDYTAQSVEQMNRMVQKNSENAVNTAQSSLASKNKADGGKEVVSEMLISMKEINDSNEQIMNQVHQSNQQMSEIVKVISEIGQKTKVINDIVFQTKLLSFNASVEAERAGDHGKGFAVVAEEVGTLAEMSGKAAQEISGILDQSTKKVEFIVQDTKVKVEKLISVGKEKVQSGSVVVERCASMLDEIIQNVSHVSVMAGEISGASQEQAGRVNDITAAMKQLDRVTQQNAGTSEDVAEAAAKLANQSESLKSVVNHLVSMIEGKK